ncbi:alpha/beta hydrolase family protein [Aestuariibacter sp. AA17]|uniref:Alpha/beta hydrolase family protein n=1 Tax=Fluctibacter corallii TaxID=2984329 RepID=A0ABT3A816_9ALTE|nr:alpha/beta hydrolase family protein [Aestuariibacter sp. AA17]MCV2884461.1 alpha/beta hydrolase family protein [Aestuariibacter sp. AA17]
MNFDVERALFQGEYKTLLAGEREFIAVIREGYKPINQGIAILLGDIGENPLNGNSLARMSPNLNRYGYTTVSASSPFWDMYGIPKGFGQNQQENTDSQAAAAPAPASDEEQTAVTEQTESAKTDNTNAPSESSNPEPEHPRAVGSLLDIAQSDAHKQALSLQVQAILNATEEYTGFRLIIARGTTAAVMLSLLNEEAIPLPDAFVAVSPFWPEREGSLALVEDMAQTSVPVLDVYSQWDNPWSLAFAEHRNIAANKALKLHYRQRELPGQRIDHEQFELLSKAIYGWLTSMGW